MQKRQLSLTEIVLHRGSKTLLLAVALFTLPPLLLPFLAGDGITGLSVRADMHARADTHAGTIDACDWEVAHPSDPDRVGPGRGSGDVDTARAIAACQAAIERHPEVARFHYQLGRAQVYAADRDGTDWNVGMPALQRAADLQHRQAMFVLGLMLKRAGDVCASEPWTHGAAELGLKSARISYVNDYLSGALDDCQPQGTLTQMTGYLTDARAQVSGYYENMLLDALERHLQVAVAAAEAGP